VKVRSLTRVASALLAVALLPACGGGGAAGAVPEGGAVLDGNPTTGGTDGGTDGTPDAPAPSLVKTRVVVDPTTPEALEELCKAKQAQVLGECEGTDYCIVEIPKGTKIEDFVKDLEDEPCIEDVQPDHDVKFPEGDGTTVPAFVDEDLSSIRAQLAVERIGARVAQSRGRLGVGAVVAVIDTGVDFGHPSLAGRLLSTGYDFIGDDDDPTDVGNGLDDNRDGHVDEGVGHGTFVASLILAVAPGCKLMPIRALDGDAMGTAAGVARAIVWAATNGATVINFSGGLDRDLRLIRQAIRYAEVRNVPVICAAGNLAGPVDFPAAHESTVAVASLDLDDVRSEFSAFGPEVDLSAPGEDLLGAHPLSPSGVARWSGTSFATALVSGGFAVLMAGLEPIPYVEHVEWLQETAVPVDDLNPDFAGGLGAGRLDLDAATVPED
jgi:thermitase